MLVTRTFLLPPQFTGYRHLMARFFRSLAANSKRCNVSIFFWRSIECFKFYMFRMRKYHQIFNTIISNITIDMMNVLGTQERSTKILFHNNPMEGNVFAIASGLFVRSTLIPKSPRTFQAAKFLISTFVGLKRFVAIEANHFDHCNLLLNRTQPNRLEHLSRMRHVYGGL